MLGLKGNQGTLHQEAQLLFEQAIAHGLDGVSHAYHETIEKGHGRIEARRLWCTDQVAWFQDRKDWPGLRSFACVESQRTLGDKTTTERRYFISSLDGRHPRVIADAIRGHWGIENRLHWSLDVSFREDDSRIRQGHAAQNYSRLRRLALNLLKKDKTRQVGLKGKMKGCGWDHQYLLNVLTDQKSK